MASKADLAQFLKEARVKAGLSQGDVADKLGYATPQFISNWERGISAPPISGLKVLANLYKISADKMFEILLEEEIKVVTEDLKRKYKASR